MTNTAPGRHRADTPVRTVLARDTYRPAHCAATSCLHDHPADPRPSLGVFRSVLEQAALVVARPLARESA